MTRPSSSRISRGSHSPRVRPTGWRRHGTGGRGKAGAGQRLVPCAAKHHDQVSLVMAYSEDRCGGCRVGVFQETELGVPRHQVGIAMGERWR